MIAKNDEENVRRCQRLQNTENEKGEDKQLELFNENKCTNCFRFLILI